MVAIGETLFFTAADGVHGRELWRSDGTSAGTRLVKNINPNDSGDRSSSKPKNLTVVGGRLFFTARDGTHGRELWTSDGTRAGTVLVKNISQTASSHPSALTAMGGRLFFSAEDGTHGRELWRSDGTRAGTVLVKDIDPIDYVPHYPGSDPSGLTVSGGRLFFSASDGTHARELWRSDGSRAGTVLVKDVNPGGAFSGSYPSSLTPMGGRLFFSAKDGSRGRELWRSDGTRAGTVLVKDIAPDGSSRPFSLTASAGQLFFSAQVGRDEGLWRSDGTRSGTVLVGNLDLNDDYGDENLLTPLAGQVYFAAADGIHGQELWTSDGSAAGTVLVKNIDPCDDVPYGYGSYPSLPAAVAGQLFFAADDGAHGDELWTSDGTAEGTVLVKDIKPGPAG